MKKVPFFIFSTLLVSCVSTGKMEERLAAERKKTDSVFSIMNGRLASQNREIITLKDSIRNAEFWKQQFEKQTLDVYETAVVARDINTAKYALQTLLTTNPGNYPWAYDSLAFYHYFHTPSQEMGQGLNIATQMINAGLKINPGNNYLKEIKARMLLMQQDDTGSIALFRSLFDSTGDYTYHWYATYIELARGNIKTAEKAIQKVLSSNPATLRRVRLDHFPEHLREAVPVKAAFLYLRAMVEQSRQQYQPMVNTLKEALKAYPDFYLAAKDLEQIRQASRGMYR